MTLVCLAGPFPAAVMPTIRGFPSRGAVKNAKARVARVAAGRGVSVGACNTSGGHANSSRASWRSSPSFRRGGSALERGSSTKLRAIGGDFGRGKWVEGVEGIKNDPLAGARSQTSGLRERLADITNGTVDPQGLGSGGNDTNETDETDDDWPHWLAIIDKAETEGEILDALEGQLKNAIATQDFTEAASLKRTIKHLRQADPVAKIETGYKTAVANEDYNKAASFRDKGAGLVGWWNGRGFTEEEPGGQYGVMMRITAEHGRYVGRSFSARELAALQENAKKKFLTKDDGNGQHGFRSGDGSVWDDDELVGHCVFELWVEHDEKTGVDLYKAVRIDHFAVGVGGEGEDDDDDEDGSAANGKGFATALGGFPLSGPIGGGTAVSDDEFTEVEAGGEKNDDPIANQSGFFAWHVENGIVRASHGEQRDDQTSPFPFNVDGVSMEELLDYETRFGFVAEFSGKTIGFAEVWERMKKENELGDGRTNDSSKDSSTVSSKDSGRTDQKPKDAKKRREPRDAYFFEQYVINETWGDAGDTGIIDLDDFDDAFDLDDDDDEIDGLDLFGGELTDDDDDFTDADAFAMLNGRRLDQLPKGLPAAMLSDIQSAIEQRGLGRGVFPDDENDDDDGSHSGGLLKARGDGSDEFDENYEDEDDDDDDDPWQVEEVRVPVNMRNDGVHAFRVWSDAVDEEEDGFKPTTDGTAKPTTDGTAKPTVDAFKPPSGAFRNLDLARINRGERARVEDMKRTIRDSTGATKEEVEAAMRDGLAEAKRRLAADDVRNASKDASRGQNAPKKGATERIIVNLGLTPKKPGGSSIGKESESTPPGEAGKHSDDGESKSKKKEKDSQSDDPTSLDSNASGMRFSSNSAANVFGSSSSEKSKGERLFERLVDGSLDEDDETTEAGDAETAASDASTSSTDDDRSEKKATPEVPKGFIPPNSFDDTASTRDFRDSVDDDADALIAALAGDADDLPLPMNARFTRIPPNVAHRKSSDPFDRLYLGAFGPHGPEVLRLVRGRWGDEAMMGDDCVTAVKLTGDANVPAGAASFRAKIGNADKLDSSFSYPEELGVVTRYKGQGRVAKPGFQERNWVDGELLLLDGKGGQLTGGAELGFVWAVPGERRLLILFSSLELPANVPPQSMYLD